MKANRLFIACVAAVSLAACGGGTDYKSTLTGAAEKPAASSSTATGESTVTVSDKIEVTGTFKDLTANASAAHIHGPADSTGVGAVFCTLSVPSALAGSITAGTGAGSCADMTLTAEQQKFFEDGKMYVNIHTSTNPGGEIRGDLKK
jgi:hypothetical protein